MDGVETFFLQKKFFFYNGIVLSDCLTELVTMQKEVKGIWSNNDGHNDDDNDKR